jgi:DNA-binding XRE family transcriptional regulator
MEKNRYFDYVMGCAIEASRKKAKKTKKALYTHMGISRQTYERYIKGETHAPIPLMLKALLYCGISDC